VVIREALPGEMAAVGDLRVAAYVAGGHMSADSGYAPRLRSLGADGEGTVLVAVTEDGVVGTIMIQRAPHAGEIVQSDDEAEIRALAVDRGAQGQGVGWALLTAALQRAADDGIRHLLLATQTDMVTAHRLYERAGFRRLPERDWSPQSGTNLLVYGLKL
jgi:ribosomal protein S18 acetylase RimI-like enzyme